MRPDQASHRVRDARCIDASQMPVSNGPLPILASPPLTTPDDFALCKADPRQNCGNNGSPDERRAGDVIGSRLGAWRAAISGGTPACRHRSAPSGATPLAHAGYATVVRSSFWFITGQVGA